MFGPRFSTVFASRWRALWFAASMLLLAYCTVPASDQAQEEQTRAIVEATRAAANVPPKD